MAVDVYAEAFLNYVRGVEPRDVPRDGCTLIAAFRVPLTVKEAEAVLGAVAAGADFGMCLDRAVKYIAVAVANVPGSSFILRDKLRKLIVDLEDRGLHREAFMVAVAGARSGSPSLLSYVAPRGWAEEVLYAELAFDLAKGTVDEGVYFDLGEVAMGAALSACEAGTAPCRYAKAALFSRLAASLAFVGQLDVAEEYLEIALRAFEELESGFNANELGEYLNILFPFGWSDGSVKTVMNYLAFVVFSVATSVYRNIDDEKMFAYVEELYRRVRGTPFELPARFNWARFAYVFGRIGINELAKEVEEVYSALASKAFVGADPAFVSRLIALYVPLLAALGRGEEAVELYNVYAKAVKPTARYLMSSYLALLGLVDGVSDELRRVAVLDARPEDELAVCIRAGLCPPEPVLAERNDTAAAPVFDLAARGECERALEIAQRYLGVRSIKERELWDDVVVALEGRDCEMLKRVAFNLLAYVD